MQSFFLIKQKIIKREDLIANRHLLYIFGDNCIRTGMGGQAGEMRKEPNAFGIVTKITPGMDNSSFFSDDSIACKQVIDRDFQNLCQYYITDELKALVIPADGIGSGLSEMPTRCPQLYEYVNSQWERIINEVNKRRAGSLN